MTRAPTPWDPRHAASRSCKKRTAGLCARQIIGLADQAQLEFIDDKRRERSKQSLIGRAEAAGQTIDRAQGTDAITVGRFQRRPEIGADMGSPVKSGLEAKRASSRASTTLSALRLKMVWVRNDKSRAVSSTSSPCCDVNHCHSTSTSVTAAIGTFKTVWTSSVIRSNYCSHPLSSTQ
jgi:hypothetical protein